MSSRKIPEGFQRPAVQIGQSVRRAWKTVPVSAVQVGDMISEYGRVQQMEPAGNTMRVWAGDREYYIEFPVDHPVYAFTVAV